MGAMPFRTVLVRHAYLLACFVSMLPVERFHRTDIGYTLYPFANR